MNKETATVHRMSFSVKESQPAGPVEFPKLPVQQPRSTEETHASVGFDSHMMTRILGPNGKLDTEEVASAMAAILFTTILVLIAKAPRDRSQIKPWRGGGKRKK